MGRIEVNEREITEGEVGGGGGRRSRILSQGGGLTVRREITWKGRVRGGPRGYGRRLAKKADSMEKGQGRPENDQRTTNGLTRGERAR